MFILAHLGIGSKIVSPWTKGLSLKAVYLGTLLPDLIDKPLYYGVSLYTHLTGTEQGFISTTRTVAHTGIFLVVLAMTAYVKRSKLLAAITLGVASHLLLDGFNLTGGPPDQNVALIFPFGGFKFADARYVNLREHLSSFANLGTLIEESIGALILITDYYLYRRQSRKTSSRPKK
jgi:hypothetical protein